MPEEAKPETALPPINEPPKEIEVKLATGQVYRGKTHEEVVQQLVRAQEEASRTISELRRQPEPEPVPPANNGEFDVNLYYKLLAENPVAANNYMLGWQLGIPAEEVVPTLRYVYDTTQKADASMQIAEFHSRHPEYPGGKDVADLITAEIESRGKDPLRATWQDLESAYYTLREAKKIIPLEKPGEATQTPTYAPSLGGGGGGVQTDLVDEFSKKSSAEMEAYFKKAGIM